MKILFFAVILIIASCAQNPQIDYEANYKLKLKLAYMSGAVYGFEAAVAAKASTTKADSLAFEKFYLENK